MNYILAVDQSTSATKALVYDVTGKLIDKASLDHQQIYPQPGWVEHDAESIWQNTLSVLKTVVERNGALVGDLLCLSIANQRETIVVFDRKTGEPLHNAIVWQCRRGDPICTALVEAGHSDTVRRRTGLKIDTYFSGSKLKWLVQNKPEIREKLSSGDALAGTVDTYLMYRLTGGETFATDHTNASRTLLYDIGRLCWDEELCGLFEVPSKALPQVRESSSRYGETDIEDLLDSPIPICGVMGDSQASLFAQRCFNPGMAKVTFGTGSSILLNIGGDLRFSESGAVSTIAWVYNGKPTYAFEGIINYSGATIAWLKNQLELIDDASQTEEMATAVQDNGGVYLVPAFSGLSAPYWSQTARAAILGLTAHSTKNHVVRASLESIAYQIRDALDMMRDEADVALKSIHADGGATANRFLMQFTADMLGLELRASEVPEFSPLGAALSGALGMGVYGSLDELTDLAFESTSYTATTDRAVAEEYYGGWMEAVRRVL
jgi:glycerol kinase